MSNAPEEILPPFFCLGLLKMKVPIYKLTKLILLTISPKAFSTKVGIHSLVAEISSQPNCSSGERKPSSHAPKHKDSDAIGNILDLGQGSLKM